jgi:predicted RNase H-like nuclease (RuvC/YqgF family)
MKTKVAVATVSGKAYFLIVNELRERNMAFLSLIPGDPVPAEAKVVITTEKEKHLINHEKVLVYDEETPPSITVNEAVKILQGKESYEKIIIGIDPGEVFGLAVVADGKVNETENCFSVQEVLGKIKNIIKNTDASATVVSVKIGNGVPAYKELLEELDSALPPKVVLEVVSEAGTNRHISENKQRRGLRDIVSAIRIAGRVGYVYSRRKTDESNS